MLTLMLNLHIQLQDKQNELLCIFFESCELPLDAYSTACRALGWLLRLLQVYCRQLCAACLLAISITLKINCAFEEVLIHRTHSDIQHTKSFSHQIKGDFCVLCPVPSIRKAIIFWWPRQSAMTHFLGESHVAVDVMKSFRPNGSTLLPAGKDAPMCFLCPPSYFLFSFSQFLFFPRFLFRVSTNISCFTLSLKPLVRKEVCHIACVFALAGMCVGLLPEDFTGFRNSSETPHNWTIPFSPSFKYLFIHQ